MCRELAALRASELLPGGDAAQHEARAALVRVLSDWHLLAFLGQTGILSDEEMQRLCAVAVSHDTGSALDALLASSGWQTLVAIAGEYAAPEPPAAGAADDASGAEPSAARDDASAPGADAGGGVACPHCTFVNAPGSTDCDVCGLPLH